MTSQACPGRWSTWWTLQTGPLQVAAARPCCTARDWWDTQGLYFEVGFTVHLVNCTCLKCRFWILADIFSTTSRYRKSPLPTKVSLFPSTPGPRQLLVWFLSFLEFHIRGIAQYSVLKIPSSGWQKFKHVHLVANIDSLSTLITVSFETGTMGLHELLCLYLVCFFKWYLILRLMWIFSL